MNNSEVNQLHKLLIAKSTDKNADVKNKLIRQRFNKISLCCNKDQTVFFDVKTCTLWMISGNNQKNCEQAWVFLAWSFANPAEINNFAKLPFSLQRNKQLSSILKIIDTSKETCNEPDIVRGGGFSSLFQYELNRQNNSSFKKSSVDQLKNNDYEIMVNYYFRNKLDEFIDWAIDEDLKLYDVNDLDKNLLEVKTRSSLVSLYKDIDYNRCRLPELVQNQFTDHQKGLWELYGLNQDQVSDSDALARDPRKDIVNSHIGIDFGTSSTVVAYENANGKAQLLRIGVNDFYEEVIPEHYENPTVLEFLDFQKMYESWTELSQQPLVDWNDVRCSHEALHNLRNNKGNPKIVASILRNLKQWALREAIDDKVRITDQINGYEYQLESLVLNNPVKGQGINVSSDDIFDPIELYAWFLGLNINWRSRGIFLKYYMTFPVAYSREVKDKILASFRRGLLRSLSAALLNTNEIEKFSVEECATEPAAYAAAVMAPCNIEPTEEGVAYSVFDFGGGTTDFDFGYYRLSTDEEYNRFNIEEVFEHSEAAGDKFLGGENLLENMAYFVFQQNIDVCRQNKIVFTKPLDAEHFAGSELFIEKTQAAHTNTLMLMSYLRPIWEGENRNSKGIERLQLLNRDGESVSCELIIPEFELVQYLEDRIFLGIENFFSAMHKAFSSNMPKDIHVLLAGNSCKSKIVQDAFGLYQAEQNDDVSQQRHQRMNAIYHKLFHDQDTCLDIHAPLSADITDESRPTAKTGVALGILNLCSGSGIKIIDKRKERSNSDAPFLYYVGRARRRKFQAGIHRNAAYSDWQELGVVAEDGIFNLFYTQSDRAYSGEMMVGDSALYKLNLEFSTLYAGHRIYAKPVAPNKIELVTVESSDDVYSNNFSHEQFIMFD